MLKNSPTFAVTVPINLSIKLGFVSVNGSRETCFVEALLTTLNNENFLCFNFYSCLLLLLLLLFRSV